MAATRSTSTTARWRTRRRAYWPAAVTAVGLAVLAGATGTAQAGGVDFATCPSGVRGDVSVEYQENLSAEYPGPDELGSLARLDEGFYAQSGAYWPPLTAVTCQTVPGGAGQPQVKVQPQGCPPDWVGFDIPQGGPGAVEWGTYLPAGLYTLGTVPSDPGWTTVCWTPLDPVVPLV